MLAGLGPHSRLWGPTAAAVHQFDGFGLRKPFHFVIPRGGNRQRVGHHVHTSLHLPSLDCEEHHGMRVTSPTRTLIDLAVTSPIDRLTVALDSALRDQKTSEAFLHRRILDLRGRGRYGIPKLLAAIEGVEAIRGAHSWLERRFMEICGEAGLPRPVPQQVLGRRDGRLIRVDCHFPSTHLVVELLGYRYHRTVLQMQYDAARLNELQLRGFVVLQFTYLDVVEHPEDIVAQLHDALQRRAA